LFSPFISFNTHILLTHLLNIKMPSFTTLTFVATLALSAFTNVSARPMGLHNSIIGAQVGPIIEVRQVNQPSSLSAALQEPTNAPSAPIPSASESAIPSEVPTPATPAVHSLPAILGELVTAVTPLFAELGSLTKQNATVDIVQPIVGDINNALNIAITEVNTLIDQPVEVVLATAKGVLDIGELVKLLQPFLTLVFTALGSVLNLLSGVTSGEVFTLLKSVGALVGELLALVLDIVGGLAGGLLGTVFSLVGPLLTGTVLPILTQLGLNDVIGAIGI